MNLLRAITTVGSYTLLSRIAGFVRDILIARYMGASMVADAFFVAFRFPNLFRSLFAEGAFSAAFVPLFAGQVETEGQAKARQFANDAFTLLALILIVFVGLMEIFMPLLVMLLAPGFTEIEGKIELATDFSRIAFPYLLFISLACLQSGVLNSLGKFAAAAAAPIILNVTLVCALLFFTPYMETPGHALVWGVFLAGVLQFAWLSWHCWRTGFPIRPVRPKFTPLVKKLTIRALPVVFGSSLYQINLLIGTLLASLIGQGAVSYLYYADRITQFPLGVIGIAVSTALLPLLTRQLRSGELVAAKWSQNRALEFALLLTLPAAAALMTIAEPIIGTLFERGEFTSADTVATAAAMVAFAAGIPAFVLVKVLTPSFYAREDTKTPVMIAVVALLVNLSLNLVLMHILGHVGIAVSAAVASWVNVVLLAIILKKRRLIELDGRVISRVPRIFAATGFMVTTLWLLEWALFTSPIFEGVHRIFTLAILIGVGGTVYVGACLLFKATGIAELKQALKRTPAPVVNA